jgi:hypothetical protein
VIAWSGPEAPTYPRFPIAKGLNGACVASRKPVIVQDVASDSRYLTTIGGTRGEMIQPVFDETGVVVGTIDVESDRVNAFGARGRRATGGLRSESILGVACQRLTSSCSGPVTRRGGDGASAPFHYALASPFIRRRAAAELRR